MPYAVVIVVGLVLAGLALLFDGGEAEPRTAPAPLPAASVADITAAVERERGLQFDGTPEVERVTPEEARAEAAALLDEDYPPARRRADAEVLSLLGLVEPGLDLGEIQLSAFDSAVAGYYDPRSGSLRVIEGAQTGNRVLYETVVAHELTHALDDDAFDFDLDGLAAGGDAALAYTTLIEGSASALMTRYQAQRFDPEEALAGSLASAFAGTGTEEFPPFLTAQLLFPYVTGEAFVTRLLEAGGGGWDVVDTAFRFRPPASTEQVLHPQKYLEVEEPDAVEAPVLDGWRVLQRSVLGEWQTGQVLARAGGTAAGAAAAGWGGDGYVLLGRGDERALAVRWTWDTPEDRQEFLRALRDWGDGGLPESEPAGPDAWEARDGFAVVAVRGGAVTLAIAPDEATARRLASAR